MLCEFVASTDPWLKPNQVTAISAVANPTPRSWLRALEQELHCEDGGTATGTEAAAGGDSPLLRAAQMRSCAARRPAAGR